MIFWAIVALAGGYLAGRHLPPVLRVFPAGLLLLDGAALFALTHMHGGFFFGQFLLYIVCAFVGMSKKEPLRPEQPFWWWHSLDMVALAGVWLALLVYWCLYTYYCRHAGLSIV